MRASPINWWKRKYIEIIDDRNIKQQTNLDRHGPARPGPIVKDRVPHSRPHLFLIIG
jgi:hypothetical protein